MRPSTSAVALRRENRPARRRVNPWRWLYVGLPVAAKLSAIPALGFLNVVAVGAVKPQPDIPGMLGVAFLAVEVLAAMGYVLLLAPDHARAAWRYIERRAHEDDSP